MCEFFTPVNRIPGLNTLPHNPCKLLGFQLLVLLGGESFHAVTGEVISAAPNLAGVSNTVPLPKDLRH